MRRSIFLLISGLMLIAFGVIFFFFPQFAAKKFGMDYTVELGSAIRGMGGLTMGSGLINLLFRKNTYNEAVRALLIANIFTQILGIAADLWALYDEALGLNIILSLQALHLFVGIGSAIFLFRMNKETIRRPA